MMEETQTNLSKNFSWKEAGVFLWDLLKILLIAGVIILPFRWLIAEPFIVSGSSMLPNFHNRDYLIIDRLSYRSQEPQRGDVIVLKFPKDISQYYIKRIVGLPGEKVKLQQGAVYIFNQTYPQGFLLKESYLRSDVETLGKNEQINLGSGEYYVLGDNRTASSDSRVWGVLPRQDIVGKAWMRVFPVKAFGLLKTPQY